VGERAGEHDGECVGGREGKIVIPMSEALRAADNNVAMPILGITRIEKSVTRGRQNNTSHACQRLSQHESRVSSLCHS
jgi:hypothetical protein